MDKRWQVFIYDQHDMFANDLFQLLTEFYDPGDLIHAALMYFYHNESFFLDDINENLTAEKMSLFGYCAEDITDLSKTVEEATNLWLESFYPVFEELFKPMARERRYVYHKTIHSRKNETITLFFRRRSSDEPFHPAY